MASEAIFIAGIQTLFAILGAVLATKLVLPKLADVLDGVVEDETSVNGLIFLLHVFIWLTTISFIFMTFSTVHAKAGTYLAAVKPIIDIPFTLLPYLVWIIVGVGAVVVVKHWRK